MFSNPFLKKGELLRVGRRRFIVVAYVAMRDARACLECGMGAFDLFADRDRHRRIVDLFRYRSGDSHANYTRIRHAISPLFRQLVVPALLAG